MIRKELGITPELISGSGGVYDIHADGVLVYSRRASDNRFPDDDELLELLRGARDG